LPPFNRCGIFTIYDQVEHEADQKREEGRNSVVTAKSPQAVEPAGYIGENKG
jgi:hypothetical protein